MKKIYITLGLVALLSTSCEDFLNTKPIDKVAAVNYFTDEESLTQGLAAVYDPLSSTSLYKNYIWLHLEGSTDESYYARNSNQPPTSIYTFNTGDAVVRDLWGTLYDGANRANDLIANINLPKMDEGKRQVILGEALFLRGYYYFMLTSRFGDVPMKLTPTSTPEGLQVPNAVNKVCKLRKAIYGLKQASRCWNIKFCEFLNKYGFVRCDSEWSVFVRKIGENFIYLALFIDDGMMK